MMQSFVFACKQVSNSLCALLFAAGVDVCCSVGLPNGFAKKPDSWYVKTKIHVCQGKKAKKERKKSLLLLL